jgi:hypothetical protein
VLKANQTITWSNPSDITYGTTLSATQLNATVAGVSGGTSRGALTYTPPSGTLLNAGNAQTLHVDAAETSNYNAASKDVTINVLKADQTITWSNPANITYGTLLSGTQLNATVTGSGTPGASAPGALPTILCQALYLQPEHIHCMWMLQQLITIMRHRKMYRLLLKKQIRPSHGLTLPTSLTVHCLVAHSLNATVTGSGTPGASAPVPLPTILCQAL